MTGLEAIVLINTFVIIGSTITQFISHKTIMRLTHEDSKRI